MQQIRHRLKYYLPRDNFLIDLNGLVCKEWRIASCHLIDKDTKCPPIHCFVITLQQETQITTRRRGIFKKLGGGTGHQALPQFDQAQNLNILSMENTDHSPYSKWFQEPNILESRKESMFGLSLVWQSQNLWPEGQF